MEANNTNANNGKKNIINSTVVSGFVATEPKITTCTEASVIRFALAVSNRVTNKATGEVTRQSSLITVEKWAKNTNLSSFDAIRKGILVEVKGTSNLTNGKTPRAKADTVSFSLQEA